MKQYRHEIAAMRALVAMAPTSASAADLRARMQAAAKLSAEGQAISG